MNKLVTIEIETAIRNQSWATMQVGQKSLQTIKIDFSNKKIISTYTTGSTDICFISLDSIRDNFQLSNSKFDSSNVIFSAKGETASGVYIMPNINYELEFLLSFSPCLITITGSHDGYPSYNVAVNGKSVYDYIQGYIGQLLGKSDISVLRKSIPWK